MKKVNDTTFEDIVKDNPEDRVTIEVGDSKQPDFKPQFKFMRWDNEINFSLRAEEAPGATFKEENSIIKYQTDDFDVHMYDKPDASEEGGFEFEWILKNKPLTNTLTATIQTKGLDFFYQPELTQQEIDEKKTNRPDNVVGSYAVYHSTKSNHRVGDKNYKAGKAFHIYRPKAIDANGAETWADLLIENGILSVTVSQKFLDEAVYPVRVDPTFGLTTIGASESTATGNMQGSRFTSGSDFGTVTKISTRAQASTGTFNLGNAIYTDASTMVRQAVDNGDVSVSITEDWYDTNLDFVGSPSTSYYLLHWSSAATKLTRFDTTTDNSFSSSASVFESWPATVSRGTPSKRLYSIYATYTASGGAAAQVHSNILMMGVG